MAKVTHRAAVAPAPEQLRSTEGASDYLRDRWSIRRRPRTLRQMRRDGDGPKFRRYGNDVVYTPSAIDEWVAACFGTEVASTTEESARRLLSAAREEEEAPSA